MGVLSLSCLLGRTRPNGNGDSPNSFAEINVVHNLDILPGNRDKVQKSGANKFAVLESLEEEDNGGGRNCGSGLLDPITATEIPVSSPENKVEEESAAVRLLDSI